MATHTYRTIPESLAVLKNEQLAQSLYDEGGVIMEGTLLTLHGEAHRTRRRLEMRVFKRSFFRYYETEVFPRALAELLGPTVSAGACDLVDFGYRITMNLTADFAGVDRPARSTGETAELLELVKTFSEGATLVHSTRDKDEVREEVRAALRRFESGFLRHSVERRLTLIGQLGHGELAEEDLPRDVLTVLLRNEDQLDLPADLLCREIAFFLQAGSHSTANSMVHAMHNLFEWTDRHPEDRERLLTDPLFVQRCVHESFRLHPASPVAWRKPVCPMHLADGTRLDIDDRVELDLYSANRSPDVFGADAEAFNPYREVAPGHDPFGLTFGTGVHTCLGRDLDGGFVPRGAVDPSNHQYGIVAQLVRALLEAGAVPDPARPPERAQYTARPNWGSYPVVFR